MSPGDRVHQQGMHQELRVLAKSEGGDYWVIGDEQYRRHYGLIWNGSTGERFMDSMHAPFLVRGNGLVEVKG